MSHLIHSPAGEIFREDERRLSSRLPALEGARIGVLYNTKANSRELLTAIAQHLVDDYGARLGLVVGKATASLPCPSETLDRLQDEADVVLTGTADCGSCTTWSVLDLNELELRGVPTVVVGTDAFEELAHAVAQTVSLASLDMAATPHPIGGVTPAELDDKAAAMVETVHGLLTGQTKLASA